MHKCDNTKHDYNGHDQQAFPATNRKTSLSKCCIVLVSSMIVLSKDLLPSF